MDSHFGFENASPCYTTERRLDFAPLPARAKLAKLSFFFFSVLLLITVLASPTGSILPPVNKCKPVSDTPIQSRFGVHLDGPEDKFIGGA